MMSPEAESIRTLLSQMNLPSGMSWAMSEPVDEPGLLFPEEARSIARAVPNRRAEFTGGRVAARKAMWALGVQPAAVKMAESRAPMWPDGLVGSITHADEICMAMVGSSDRFCGIGIDLEPDVPMDPGLVDEICKPEDLEGVDVAERSLLPKRIFSAKEAVYKAHFALAGVPFGFHALSLDLVAKRAVFMDHPEALAIPVALRGDLFFEQWICDGMILSLCTIPK